MAIKLSRRRFSQLVIGVLGGLTYPSIIQRNQAVAFENCYWVKISGPTCNANRQLVERWCYRCCASTDCWYEGCEYRVVGKC